MAFPLVTVLGAAPGVISAAAELIRLIRDRKKEKPEAIPSADRFAELETLLEKQAELIEELAVNNRNLALAVRNNRIVAAGALLIAILALGVALLSL